jgi:hypothetical protein
MIVLPEVKFCSRGKNVLRRKVNWISHVLRRNYLLLDGIEGQMMEIKGI